MKPKQRTNASDKSVSTCGWALRAALVLSLVPSAASAQASGTPEAPQAGDAKTQPTKTLPSWMKKGGPLTPPQPPPPPPPPPPDPAAIAEATAKDEARKHFDQGLALFDAGSVATALPEFLLSRSIYPTRAATKNAALCLKRLGRFDEALEMNEELLGLPGLTPEEKAIADKELSELRPVVGSIEVEGIQPGATISIDSKPRATSPLTKPIHVPVGTRTVRIFKAGFETFEKRVEAIGGKSVSVHAVLAPLELSGWLQVDEASGYNVDVVLDGAIVGKTPWRGLIATGPHLVVLRGDKRLGTQPARVEVHPSQVTPMLLIVEELASTLRVESKMKDADLFLDGVLVGRGAWEGAVRQGSHRVQVGAEGFVTAEQRVDVKADGREVVSLLPTRAPVKGFFAANPPFLEASGQFHWIPQFGGTLETTCTSPCVAGPGLGGGVMVRGGLAIDQRWPLSIEVGGFAASKSIDGRADQINVTGLDPNIGTSSNVISLRGALIGASLGRIVGSERFPITFRLGVGGFIGTTRAVRSGEFNTVKRSVTNATSTMIEKPSVSYQVENTAQSIGTAGFYAAPEVRAGVRVTPRIDIGLSVAALVIVMPSEPTWVPERNYVQAGSDGQGRFTEETLTDSTVISISPGLSATFRF